MEQAADFAIFFNQSEELPCRTTDQDLTEEGGFCQLWLLSLINS